MFGISNPVYYKYIWNYIKISIPNHDTIVLEKNQIGGFTIEKDFDGDIFPIFKLTLALMPDEIYTILDNKDTVKFTMRLDKYAYHDDNEAYTSKSIVFDDIFGIYIDDNSAQLDKELYDETRRITKTETSINDMSTPYDFYLFKDSDLNASKTIVNTVIKKCDMTDAITYLLFKSGSKNVLMSKPDNSNTYNDVLLYPMTTLKNIEKINKRYGVYRQGMLFFYDLSRTYVINKRGKSTVHAVNEYTDVFIYCYSATNSESLVNGCEVDNRSKRYGINILISSINMKTSSDIINQTIGTDTILVDSITDNKVDINPDIVHRGNAVTTVEEWRDKCGTKNEYLQDEINARVSEQSSIFEVDFAGVDMDILSPNKRFTFVFEDSKVQKRVGGVYRLAGGIFTFQSKGYEYNIVSKCIFYKIY